MPQVHSYYTKLYLPEISSVLMLSGAAIAGTFERRLLKQPLHGSLSMVGNDQNGEPTTLSYVQEYMKWSSLERTSTK